MDFRLKSDPYWFKVFYLGPRSDCWILWADCVPVFLSSGTTQESFLARVRRLMQKMGYMLLESEQFRVEWVGKIPPLITEEKSIG